MVDFAKFLKDRHDNATPEERARMDAARAEREAEEARTRPINATFVRTAYDGHWKNGKVIEISRKTKTIGVRIDERPSDYATDSRVIQFVGGSTGYEAYRLGEDFAKEVLREDRGDEWHICAGTTGGHEACIVDRKDILAFLRQMAPDLIPAAA